MLQDPLCHSFASFRGRLASRYVEMSNGTLTMKIKMFLAALAMLLVPLAGVADARPHKSTNGASSHAANVASTKRAKSAKRTSKRKSAASRSRQRTASLSRPAGISYLGAYAHAGSYSAGPRPRKWCGWWMRTQRGGGPELNVAWNWRNYGRPAAPQVGAVVVWRHHVGEIVGQAANGKWLIRSGNDGGAVRTRPRSIAGALIRI